MYSTEKHIKDGRELLIREAAGNDTAEILAYLAVISSETEFLTFGPGEFRLTEAEEFDHLEKYRRAENCIYLLAFLEGKLAGTLSFEGGARPRTRHTGEFGTSVLREYWGAGIASALMDSLLEWSRGTGIIRKINLRVRSDNLRAINLYKRKGFSIEGTLTKQMFVGGRYYDNLWMGLEV
jgi:RimJ/RimL family protein N-acetyltransferase